MGRVVRHLARVSIHAPHARGDRRRHVRPYYRGGFNPRPSCEGRPAFGRTLHVNVDQFQSTPLMRGATVCHVITSLKRKCFNPRPSCEGRRHQLSQRFVRCCFNPRPSCEGRHSYLAVHVKRYSGFNPRPSCEGRRSVRTNGNGDRRFQSTPLMRGATARNALTCCGVSRFQSTPLMRGATRHTR